MQAAWFESFGDARDVLKIDQLQQPKPNSGEVLIRLSTSGVNPSDVKKRAGAFPHLLDDGLVIPHSDGAGIIESVGDGVTTDRVGERVWIYQAQYGRRFGTASEYITVDSNRAPKLPDNTSFEIGACLGIPAMTAHRCVFADGSVDGKTVLVTGGAGRVGYYAIQWAKQAGARVITTASNEADKAACKAIGADCVVDHRQHNWSENLLSFTRGETVDRVIDVEFGANLPEVLKVIKTSGSIVSYSSSQVKEPQLPFLQMMFMDLTIRLVLVYAMPEQAKLAAITDINSKLEHNAFQHRIAHVLPITEIVRAHQLIEQGGFCGCVVLKTSH